MNRMEFDYSKLRGRIKEIFGSYKKLEPEISFSTVTLSNKLNNKVYFSSPEILELAEALKIEHEDLNEYFFNLKVRKDEQLKQEA